MKANQLNKQGPIEPINQASMERRPFEADQIPMSLCIQPIHLNPLLDGIDNNPKSKTGLSHLMQLSAECQLRGRETDKSKKWIK